MSSFSDMLRYLRKREGLSQQELAAHLHVGKSAISMYEKGQRNPSFEMLEAIADYFNVNMDTLTGRGPLQSVVPFSEPLGEVVPFPILASVAAGYNGLAREEYTDDVEALPRSFLRGYDPSELRVLRISGNSMYPRFLDGDRVLVHLQPVVDDGEIAVCFYNGDEATVKQVYCKPNAVELVPFNPEYPPCRIEGVDLEQFQIFGKVIKLIRDV